MMTAMLTERMASTLAKYRAHLEREGYTYETIGTMMVDARRFAFFLEGYRFVKNERLPE